MSADTTIREFIQKAVEDTIAGDAETEVLYEVSPGVDTLRFTPLMLACSFRQYNCFFGTSLGEQHVEQLLSRGADVNFRKPADNVTALFLAVKYGSYGVVDKLLKAGADPNARDHLGRTALFNAVEFPMISVVKRLLDEGCSPAERVEQMRRIDENGHMITLPFKSNVAEKMLIAEEQSYVSWRIFGHVPRPEVVLCAFHLLLEYGADLDKYSLIQVGKLARMGRQEAQQYLGRQDSLMRWMLSKAYLGLDFPQQKPRAKWKEAGEKRTAREPRVEIYPEGDNYATRLLGGASISLQLKKNMFINRVADLLQTPEVRGTEAMSAEQLLLECEAMRIDTEDVDPDDRIALAGLIDAEDEKRMFRYIGEATFESRGALEHQGSGKIKSMFLETGSAASITGGDCSTVIVTPTLGASCVQVKVGGIPVAAFLSSASTLSCIPAGLANQLGIPYSEVLKSSAFMSPINGKDIDGIALVREVTVSLSEDIHVTLENAVCMPNLSTERIQLGMNFFAQAARASISVLLGGDTGDGEKSIAVLDASRGADFVGMYSNVEEDFQETLRFYAPNGKTAVLPIFHINDSLGQELLHLAISIKPDASVHECEWCARQFPGLKRCSGCSTNEVYYCSRACQRASWPTHKLSHEEAQ